MLSRKKTPIQLPQQFLIERKREVMPDATKVLERESIDKLERIFNSLPSEKKNEYEGMAKVGNEHIALELVNTSFQGNYIFVKVKVNEISTGGFGNYRRIIVEDKYGTSIKIFGGSRNSFFQTIPVDSFWRFDLLPNSVGISLQTYLEASGIKTTAITEEQFNTTPKITVSQFAEPNEPKASTPITASSDVSVTEAVKTSTPSDILVTDTVKGTIKEPLKTKRINRKHKHHRTHRHLKAKRNPMIIIIPIAMPAPITFHQQGLNTFPNPFLPFYNPHEQHPTSSSSSSSSSSASSSSSSNSSSSSSSSSSIYSSSSTSDSSESE